MTDAYIVDSIRSPRGKGKQDGSLHQLKPIDLATQTLTALKERNHLNTSQVDDVIMGCVSAVGEQGANIAKTAVLKANWAECVPGFTLNRFCASGLEAINLGAMKIKSGWQDLIVAGGIESMSRVPMGSDGGPWAFDPETNAQTYFVPQGIGADLIANIEGFSREQVDQFAFDSHHKAHAASEKGLFSKSIVPIKDRNGFSLLDHDETIRSQCSLADLAKLKPAFQKMGAMGFDEVLYHKYPSIKSIDHVHTAGNSSGIVDGSSMMLLASKAKAEELNLPVRAKIVSVAVTSTEPSIMLTGPGPASKKALALAGLKVSDIDLFEVNEAFAAVVLKFAKDLDVPLEKINVNGGAIAMGHPLGATGSMILGTLLDELESRKKRYGLCTLCVGGGMGIATIIERI